MNRPRTPEHHSRIKPRGRRTKTRLATRIRQVTVIPHAIPTPHPVANGYTFRPATNGGMGIELERWTDGYGRQVPKPSPQFLANSQQAATPPDTTSALAEDRTAASVPNP